MDLSNIDGWVHIDPVWGGWDLLFSEEHGCGVCTNCFGLEVDLEGVVLVVGCFHWDVQSTFVGQSNSDVT